MKGLLKIDQSLPYRHERKFFISGSSYEGVLQSIKMHPAAFREIFYERRVNNIYLDTHGEAFVSDNLDGAPERIKVRIRWYKKTFGRILSPQLEIKIRNNVMNRKKIFPVRDFDFYEESGCGDLVKGIFDLYPDESVREAFRFIVPKLVSSYRRRYFRSADGKFRITVDRDFCHYNTEANFIRLRKERGPVLSTVMEIKYDPMFDDEVGEITGNFPFRLSKNSKYVNGLSSATEIFR